MWIQDAGIVFEEEVFLEKRPGSKENVKYLEEQDYICIRAGEQDI